MLRRDNRPENSMAFVMRDKLGGGERNTCKHCGRYGHEQATCYEIRGHPPSWGSLGRGRARRRARGGRAAGRRGHKTANVAATQANAVEASQVTIPSLSS